MFSFRQRKLKAESFECDIENEVIDDGNEGGIYKQRKQFLLLKKRKMYEIKKNKNAKCLRIRPPMPPDVDEAIKKPFVI